MNKKLLTILEKCQQRDIDTRTKLLKENRLYEGYEKEMQNVHIENAQVLHDIISTHGWPGISLVSLDGSKTAWMIAQHSICTPDLQREFLIHITKAAEAGDASEKHVAYLTDRIRFNESKPQVYGTVLDWNEHGDLTCEVEDPDQVDERRAHLGLPPLQESLEEQRKAVAAEGGKPPSDYKAFRAGAIKWAKEVGWL